MSNSAEAIISSGKTHPLRILLITEVIVLAAAALVWSWKGSSEVIIDAPLVALLALGIATAQLFTVTTPRKQTYRPAIALLTAGVALLSPMLLSLLVLAALVPEWVLVRRSWLIRVFELAAFLLAVQLAGHLYQLLLTSPPHPLLSAMPVLALIVAALAMVISTRLLSHAMAVLSEGAAARRAVSVWVQEVVVDAALVSLGGIIAYLWTLDPWLTLLTLPPFALIQVSFRVPALREEASTDARTGLLNSKSFEAAAGREVERAVRAGQAAALIVADIDLLRENNNRYRHLAGDLVLRQVASIIQVAKPVNAVAGTLGGEHYCIIVPGADAREGLAVAESIRQMVERQQFQAPPSDATVSVTMSLGVATCPHNGTQLHQLVQEAEVAMHRAKMSGRNRSCIALIDGGALRPSGSGPYRPRQEEGILSEREAPSLRATVSPRSDGDRRQSHRAGLARPREGRLASLRTLHAVVVSIVGPALTATILLLHSHEAAWLGLLIFTAFAALNEALAVEIYGESKVSASFVGLLAGILLFGVPALAMGAAGVALAQLVPRRRAPHQILFDFGAVLLAGTGAWAVLRPFNFTVEMGHLPYLALPALAAGLTYYLVYTGLHAQAIGLGKGRATQAVWLHLFRWLAGHYLLMAALGLLLAAAYATFGVYSLIAFAVPPLAMRYAFKQYIDRTAASVRELEKANRHLRSTYENTLLALVTALEARDHETEGHSERVAQYAVKIAEEMGVRGDDLVDMHLGALLHDIGKIGLPDAILRKPGPLSDREWKHIVDHPRTGMEILQGIEFMDAPSQIVVCHHERYDGKGYPLGLVGDHIPLLARIFAVADTFDAITSDRPYRPAQTVATATAEIKRCAGTQFDPAVVDAFLRALPEIAAVPRTAADDLHNRRALVTASAGTGASMPAEAARGRPVAAARTIA